MTRETLMQPAPRTQISMDETDSHESMIWRVEIKQRPGIYDAAGQSVLKSIEDLGITSVAAVDVVQIFILEGELTRKDVETIGRELLADPVTQQFEFFNSPAALVQNSRIHVLEIAYNPGVMDPVEESTLQAAKDLGLDRVEAVRTAKKYLIHGTPTDGELSRIAEKVLMNKLIQHVAQPAQSFKSFVLKTSPAASVKLNFIALSGAGESRLKKISGERQLFLNLGEMKAIQAHFRKVGREPTDLEMETVAQTWSEHCYHKTFRGNIRSRFWDKGKVRTRVIKNLFRSTIAKVTEELNKPWCVSVFHDNAGVIKFDRETNVCFKVETHNHPSALEPFGGANTGLGGVIRDILGTGLGAKPVCSTDIFCFAPPDFPWGQLPQGALHPKRVMKGVVDGVRDYGNKMGIPTVNGAIVFDRRFVGNPLVFCGNVGILPKGKEIKCVKKGDAVVVVGGRTGRDGIHGATFSSGELTHESETVSSGAVQIGNPIEEKKVLDALLVCRDENLFSSVTDCGAGGLSSAVGEMGKDLGARVDLEKVPLKYQGLRYDEIWISESQERMVLSVPPHKVERVIKIFQSENTGATVIGTFTGTGRLELFYDGCQVCDLAMKFLHAGPPPVTKEAVFKFPRHKEPRFDCPEDLTPALIKVLGHYNVCSKETVIRQYDHEVQGTSVVKPLVGTAWDGPSDASVLRPRLDSHRGIAVANGINVRFGMIDPYWMAASCIDEAIRQIVAVGGDPERVALLDNFCWGNPDKPDRLGGLVRCAEGLYRTAKDFGAPFISGKDSLYNEYTEHGKSLAIPGTILISSLGIIEDVRKVVTMDFKKAGNRIYAIHPTSDELGASIYFDTLGFLGNRVPRVDAKKALKIFRALHRAIGRGLVRSVHDCSEGGLGVTVAEMSFAGGLGAEIFLKDVPRDKTLKREDFILFSETNSRFVAEVEHRHQRAFEKLMAGMHVGKIGQVLDQRKFIVHGLDGKPCVKTDIGTMKEAWQRPLRD